MLISGIIGIHIPWILLKQPVGRGQGDIVAALINGRASDAAYVDIKRRCGDWIPRKITDKVKQLLSGLNRRDIVHVFLKGSYPVPIPCLPVRSQVIIIADQFSRSAAPDGLVCNDPFLVFVNRLQNVVKNIVILRLGKLPILIDRRGEIILQTVFCIRVDTVVKIRIHPVAPRSKTFVDLVRNVLAAPERKDQHRRQNNCCCSFYDILQISPFPLCLSERACTRTAPVASKPPAPFRRQSLFRRFFNHRRL